MILLTGATGFVGTHLLKALLEKGYKIRALILPDEQIPFDETNLEWIRGDIRDKESLGNCFSGISMVLHMAGVVASPDKDLTFSVNFDGTRNLVDLSIENKVNRFLFMSAAAAKFKHLNAYGQSKKMAEDYLISSGIPYVLLRTPLIIGKGGYEFERFVEYVNKLPCFVIVFGDGKSIKRPIYIGDVTFAVLKLLESKKPDNKIYEIACKGKFTLNEFVDVISSCYSGKKKIKFHIPLKFSLLIAVVLERLLLDRSPITRDMLLGLNEDVDFNVNRSLNELGLTPLEMPDAVLKCL